MISKSLNHLMTRSNLPYVYKILTIALISVLVHSLTFTPQIFENNVNVSSPTTIPALLPLSSGGLPDGAKLSAILAAPDVRAAILRHWASQYVTATANPKAGSTSNVLVK